MKQSFHKNLLLTIVGIFLSLNAHAQIVDLPNPYDNEGLAHQQIGPYPTLVSGLKFSKTQECSLAGDPSMNEIVKYLCTGKAIADGYAECKSYPCEKCVIDSIKTENLKSIFRTRAYGKADVVLRGVNCSQ